MTSRYNERFRRFSQRIEKVIIAGIVICFIVLVGSEVLFQYDPARAFLIETQRLEGVSEAP
ncbi:hypothetical protein [Brevibacillus panacihumi]|uniref:Uncharacterized protein n=1 Tax=Brevibacillus panacihumi TaxID=497735 RepID=A0A3M8DBC4_9BACL|nr:hypothetical protein [Brevibacillus panacihumi]RNB84919.1 hypothetical protein EDM58_04380 [Brevibacillus panacihumi]